MSAYRSVVEFDPHTNKVNIMDNASMFYVFLLKSQKSILWIVYHNNW
ncbi:unnamed protein product, partial [marine sediment metagenome]